jgi:tetratricopeptide (TPR) repeat protein
MALDPYASCPCGSGKKFKWCCQPIHVQIDQAFNQDADGQHEAALRVMDEVVAQHPANPEAWGRKAQLLYQNDRVDEAEEALQKALEINPSYPFGHLLRGVFRQNEGELEGALLLFRKATELYDPEAHDILGQLYSMIAECELKLNRPVAGRAALRIALHHQPGNEDLRKGFEGLFGDKGTLPLSARREYTFQSPPAGGPAADRSRWDAALAGATTGRLSNAVHAFEQLTQANAEDAPAWHNLGVSRAWLGDDRGAIEALDRYVALKPDEGRAAAAWALAEVLRCGHGMEEQADYVEHSLLFQLRDPERIATKLQRWEAEGRLIVLKAGEQQTVFTAVVLERPPALAPALAAVQPLRVGAFLLIFGDRLRLWHTSTTALSATVEELQHDVGPALSEPHREETPAHFSDVLAEAMAFPAGRADADTDRRVREHIERFFEETWIHRPLRSLNLIPPVDAAGHAVLRKKLAGVIQFLQECGERGLPAPYDFDRLRRKLGLLGGAAPAGARDIGAMSVAELSALPAEGLPDAELEDAYQAALKLDAREVAGRFARVLVARPPRPERSDRYPWYQHLVQLALDEGDTQAALDRLNEGEKADCEQNEGRRRNEYELRRAQIHARRGEADEAQGLFERLIERAPAEPRYRGSAAEAMLSLKRPDRAVRFAEQGLTQARTKNDRDSEGYFMELLEAARRQERG